MAVPTNELEMQFNIFNNTSSEWFEIGPDRNGLELVEIRYYDGKNHAPTYSLLFNLEQARLLHLALGKLLEYRQTSLDIQE